VRGSGKQMVKWRVVVIPLQRRLSELRFRGIATLHCACVRAFLPVLGV